MNGEVGVGLIGTGFAARVHVEALRRVASVHLVAVASSRFEEAEHFAGSFGVSRPYRDYRALLEDEGVQVVSLCVPNWLHEEIGRAALQAGKHIICEKPLTGSFLARGNEDPILHAKTALQGALRSADMIIAAAEANGRRIFYAENWVYAPALAKARALLAASGAPILDIRAEQSHSGSHAAASKRSDLAGGGALLTLGAHPIGAAIHLKNVESQRLGHQGCRVTSVVADVVWPSDRPTDRAARPSWLVPGWVDVDTWSTVVLTFADSSKAVVSASFGMLGGVRNLFEAYTPAAAVRCSMSQVPEVLAYAPGERVFGDEYLAEKVQTTAGWNLVAGDEFWSRGYVQEMQDFIECVIQGREPLSGPRLGRDVVEVVYSSYLSAATGSRVDLPDVAAA